MKTRLWVLELSPAPVGLAEPMVVVLTLLRLILETLLSVSEPPSQGRAAVSLDGGGSGYQSGPSPARLFARYRYSISRLCVLLLLLLVSSVRVFCFTDGLDAHVGEEKDKWYGKVGCRG